MVVAMLVTNSNMASDTSTIFSYTYSAYTAEFSSTRSDERSAITKTTNAASPTASLDITQIGRGTNYLQRQKKDERVKHLAGIIAGEENVSEILSAVGRFLRIALDLIWFCFAVS